MAEGETKSSQIEAQRLMVGSAYDEASTQLRFLKPSARRGELERGLDHAEAEPDEILRQCEETFQDYFESQMKEMHDKFADIDRKLSYAFVSLAASNNERENNIELHDELARLDQRLCCAEADLSIIKDSIGTQETALAKFPGGSKAFADLHAKKMYADNIVAKVLKAGMPQDSAKILDDSCELLEDAHVQGSFGGRRKSFSCVESVPPPLEGLPFSPLASQESNLSKDVLTLKEFVGKAEDAIKNLAPRLVKACRKGNDSKLESGVGALAATIVDADEHDWHPQQPKRFEKEAQKSDMLEMLLEKIRRLEEVAEERNEDFKRGSDVNSIDHQVIHTNLLKRVEALENLRQQREMYIMDALSSAMTPSVSKMEAFKNGAFEAPPVASIEGTWSHGSICGTTLMWGDKKIRIVKLAPRSLAVRINDKDVTAELVGKNELRWSTGEVWQRVAIRPSFANPGFRDSMRSIPEY